MNRMDFPSPVPSAAKPSTPSPVHGLRDRAGRTLAGLATACIILLSAFLAAGPVTADTVLARPDAAAASNIYSPADTKRLESLLTGILVTVFSLGGEDLFPLDQRTAPLDGRQTAVLGVYYVVINEPEGVRHVTDGKPLALCGEPTTTYDLVSLAVVRRVLDEVFGLGDQLPQPQGERFFDWPLVGNSVAIGPGDAGAVGDLTLVSAVRDDADPTLVRLVLEQDDEEMENRKTRYCALVRERMTRGRPNWQLETFFMRQ